MSAANKLVLLCILTTAVAALLDEAFVVQNLAFSTDNLLEGRIWTLITSLFLHANFLHLLGNIIFLYVFGNTLEKIRSPLAMVGAFLYGGVLSFLLGSFFYPSGTSLVGASAGIFTLTAIVMLMKPTRWSWLLFMPVGLAAVLYFLYNLAAIYFGFESEVAYVGHVIGFMLGVPLGIAWSPGWLKNLLITILLLLIYILLVIAAGYFLGVDLPLL